MARVEIKTRVSKKGLQIVTGAKSTNLKLAQQTLLSLKKWGVKDIVLCPGGRNAPLVLLLAESPQFNVHSAFDERAAAFFALGKSQATERPVAVITTSGTAVAEVFPAVIEAHYTQTPLIVVSADRPRRLRGTGAPQAIEQNNIFSQYVEKCVDIEEEWPGEIVWSLQSPLHLNICFTEPLVDGDVSAVAKSLRTNDKSSGGDEPLPLLQNQSEKFKSSFVEFIKDKKSPLLLISSLKTNEVAKVREFCGVWPGLIYAESTSGLREIKHSGLISSGDRFPARLLKNQRIDAVVRIGGVPTARVWRDLETSHFPVFSVSSLPFAGLSRGDFVHSDLAVLKQVSEWVGEARWQKDSIIDEDQKLWSQWQKALNLYPQSEPALIRWLSQQISPQSDVYVGNSLPIREWDLTAQRKFPIHVRANRGANGIDGQIATALGRRSADHEMFILTGDLTAMYDANALWFLENSEIKSRCRLAIVNNSGGKIFERLFKHSLFYNQHNLNFKSWAEAWNCSYQKISEQSNLQETSGIVELTPDAQQTSDFWHQFDGVWL